jgi:hypothetical protein
VTEYISAAAADELAGKRLHALAWRTAAAELRLMALATAAAVLDQLKWSGTQAEADQALAWPRKGVRDERGRLLPYDTIPAAVAMACAELAFHLIGNPQPSGAAVQMRQLGDSLVTYFPTVADELPRHVRRLVEPYLRVRSAHAAELIP